MASIKSGASSDLLTIDGISKAARNTSYDSSGREVSFQSKATYSCVTANFTPAATATDIFKITGSATKTVRVIDMRMGGTATAASVIDIFLIKRATDDTLGTFVAGTKVPHDSLDVGSVATVGHYTANPTLGAPIGTVTHRKVLLPIITTTSSDAGNQLLPAGENSLIDKPIVLRGVNETLVVNNNGAAIPAGGANWYVCCTWIEE